MDLEKIMYGAAAKALRGKAVEKLALAVSETTMVEHRFDDGAVVMAPVRSPEGALAIQQAQSYERAAIEFETEAKVHQTV